MAFVCFRQIVAGHLAVAWPRPTVPGSRKVRWAWGGRSSPLPMACAERARSQMWVVMTAPGAVVHDGFQKVDSS
ncbi:hypothetical protein GCM10010353_22830 [Streptomyces chryseus]|uniref:Transposase n=1 Tax=Streptomyces chryseus TaxID=68186 RepID=A0ABQ3DQ74_9ACTN|nr:hypothetical protein GCM10010353_22830 [Streptomyces chryseus]GHB11698.1 hypothetical protein GCM10010346_38700 [Streptomyces chryseus]